MQLIKWNVLGGSFGGYRGCSGRRTELIEELMSDCHLSADILTSMAAQTSCRELAEGQRGKPSRKQANSMSMDLSSCLLTWVFADLFGQEIVTLVCLCGIRIYLCMRNTLSCFTRRLCILIALQKT